MQDAIFANLDVPTDDTPGVDLGAFANDGSGSDQCQWANENVGTQDDTGFDLGTRMYAGLGGLRGIQDVKGASKDHARFLSPDHASTTSRKIHAYDKASGR